MKSSGEALNRKRLRWFTMPRAWLTRPCQINMQPGNAWDYLSMVA